VDIGGADEPASPHAEPLTERPIGTQPCRTSGMVDEQGDERRGAQQESPAEREAKKNPADKQDLEKPSEGRDKPPDEIVEKGKRSPDSPWMGGG